MPDWDVKRADDIHNDVIQLGRAEIGEDSTEPVALVVKNTSSHTMRGVVIGSNDNEMIQLAYDNDGAPGVWADPGREVVGKVGNIKAGESFLVWTRVLPPPDGEPGMHHFKIRVRGLAV